MKDKPNFIYPLVATTLFLYAMTFTVSAISMDDEKLHARCSMVALLALKSNRVQRLHLSSYGEYLFAMEAYGEHLYAKGLVHGLNAGKNEAEEVTATSLYNYMKCESELIKRK